MAAILRYGGKKKQCRKGVHKRKRKEETEMEAEPDMNYNTVLYTIIISYQSENLTRKPSSTICQTFEVPLAAQIYL